MPNRIAKFSLLACACALALLGCHSTPSPDSGSNMPAAAAEAKPVTEVTVTQVEQLLKNKRAIVLDANDADTRKEYGIVPGAVLLSGHEDYSLSLLPAQKTEKLVFYCGGTQCRASDKAAARAAAAGYVDVNVMRAGIRGWKEAGLGASLAPQS